MPFKDGSYFYQNFIDSSTHLTISKFTFLNKEALQLYEDNKLDLFYSLFFEYAVKQIDKKIINKYIPFILLNSINTTFVDIVYLFPYKLYNEFIETKWR
jgi:hypothetical protein